MMLTHESNIFELWIEMKFEVYDPHSKLFSNTTYVVMRKIHTHHLWAYSWPTKPPVPSWPDI